MMGSFNNLALSAGKYKQRSCFKYTRRRSDSTSRSGVFLGGCFGEGCSGEGFEDGCAEIEGEERGNKIESAGLLDSSAEC